MEIIVKHGAVAAVAAALGLGPAAASAEAWEVDGKLFGKGDKKAEDISGIACDRSTGFPRACLAVDDEAQGAQWLTLEDGRLEAGDRLPLIDDVFDGKPLELDGEGVAFADGAFYVIGSHGLPRRDDDMPAEKQQARLAADSHLFRITPGADGVLIEDSPALAPLIADDAALGGHAERPLDENGVTVEGVAVRGGSTFVGFRTPVLGENDRAAVLEVATAALFGGAAETGALHLLDLGAGRGVRDLAALDDGLLILAGPGPDDPHPGPSAVYRWTPGEDEAVEVATELPCDGAEPGKPEAILPVDRAGATLRLLVMFDGAEEGEPHACSLAF